MPPTQPGETWAPVPGYEGRYLVSTHGRVWSLRRDTSIREGSREDGHHLMNVTNGKIRLSKTGDDVRYNVTRLVLLAHGPPQPSPQHYARKIDPEGPIHLENLRWQRPITRAKLTEDEVIAIYREAHRECHTQREIAERYGVSPQTISHIKHGRVWSHVTEDVNPPVSQSNRSPRSKS